MILDYFEELWLQEAESEEQGEHLAEMHFVLKDCLWRQTREGKRVTYSQSSHCQ